ncbi:MAG TPA: DUF3618 domain-containing protein [Kineosporiaceae bacterium]|nr:DUF3618 domain-containing protein [Kineosporiaceae bacterium]
MGADQRADGPGLPPDPLPQDPDALEQIVDARRRNLAATVDELVYRAHPKQIARRAAEDLRQRAVALVTDEQGELRYERIGAATTAVVLVVVVVIVRRRASRA